MLHGPWRVSDVQSSSEFSQSPNGPVIATYSELSGRRLCYPLAPSAGQRATPLGWGENNARPVCAAAGARAFPQRDRRVGGHRGCARACLLVGRDARRRRDLDRTARSAVRVRSTGRCGNGAVGVPKQCGSRRSRCKPCHTAAAAISAAFGAPTPVVAPFVVVGLAVMTTIHPTSAALLPRIARSTTISSTRTCGWHIATAPARSSGRWPQPSWSVSVAPKRCSPPDRCGPPSHSPPRCGGRRPSLRTAWGGGASQPQRVIRRALAELREHPWSRGVLCVASARNLIVGAFDVLLVILALDALDLGDSGAGVPERVGRCRVARQHVGDHRRRASGQVARRPDGGHRRRGDVVDRARVADRTASGVRRVAVDGAEHGVDGRLEPDAAATVHRSAQPRPAVRGARVSSPGSGRSPDRCWPR